MKPLFHFQRQRASTIVVVLLLGAIAALILAGTMSWTVGTSQINDSAMRHTKAVAAAEAGTEKVIAEMGADFAKQGAGIVNANLPSYRANVPTAAEDSFWERYQFSDGLGDGDRVFVQAASPWTSGTPLSSQYHGLSGYAATFRIKAEATDLEANHKITGAVQQDVQLALIPIFQFAIFYNLDLEINPGPPMLIGGRTHANKNIYLQPDSILTFAGDITSAEDIIPDKKPGDPLVRNDGTIVFNGEHDGGVSTLNLPIGTENTPEEVRKIVEIPPDTELASSPIGQQRFYNNADLVILVKDDGLDARAGGTASATVTNLGSSISNFVNTTKSFYDVREQKTVQVTEIDVGGLTSWNASGNPVKDAIHRDIHSIYVADLRSQTTTSMPGVRLVNGAVLPPLGLTIATPDPLYVQGNFNASGASLGSHDTSNTKPAALVADAINILSGNWDDSRSTLPLANRNASGTTVNAAFLAGIVQTGGGYYSGGVENFPRFLEDWSGDVFTYNGSMVVLFESQHANSPWQGTGDFYNIYNPPNRNWYFDTNFLTPTKLPPLCPSVRAFIRGQWAAIAPR